MLTKPPAELKKKLGKLEFLEFLLNLVGAAFIAGALFGSLAFCRAVHWSSYIAFIPTGAAIVIQGLVVKSIFTQMEQSLVRELPKGWSLASYRPGRTRIFVLVLNSEIPELRMQVAAGPRLFDSPDIEICTTGK